MVLEGYRAWAAPYLDRMVRPFLSTRPARLSWTALGLSAAAGVLAALARWTTPIVFLGVAGFVFLGGVFDVLDGEVARRSGRSSPRGDLLDHVLDRYADLFVLLGIAVSGYAYPPLALLALVSLLLTSYMGTQAQAVGLGRTYGGLLARADRLILLTLATFLIGDFALPWPWAPTAPFVRWSAFGFSFTVLDIAMLWFVVAGQWTAARRALSSYRSLSDPRP
ncbi:MAG TPA: CDP-alcohol phosphatidyltransferase family protein [Thermoplasmata archaeon]|nr:CDP-alcohol phosphatidyltransferase family protein [Thermoplasmata archaeon]